MKLFLLNIKRIILNFPTIFYVFSDLQDGPACKGAIFNIALPV
jgi:hypothetical protein